MMLATTAVAISKEIPADKFPRAPGWKVLHRIADAATPGMMRSFLEAVANVRNGVVLDRVRAALARNDFAGAEAAIPWHDLTEGELREALRVQIGAVLGKSGNGSLENLPGAAAGTSFDAANPRAIAYAAERSSALVTEITEGTRAAIRDLIQRGFIEGRDVRIMARDLRELVGLTSQQALAVDNLRRTLEQQGVKPERMAQQLERYNRRLLRHRAETIARTETIDAASEGQQQLWQQAADQGLLDRQRARRFWVVTPDDRLDTTICAPIPGMNPRGVALEQPFQTPAGSRMRPTAHPRCRCALSLRVLK